jgi:amino acid transporter
LESEGQSVSGIFVVPGTAAAVAGTYSLIAWGIVAFSAACVAISIAGLFTRGGERLTFHSLFTEVFGNRIADGLILLYLVSSVSELPQLPQASDSISGIWRVPNPCNRDRNLSCLLLSEFNRHLYLGNDGECSHGPENPSPSCDYRSSGIFHPACELCVQYGIYRHALLLSAIIIVYWPFTGFEISAIPSEETRDPRMIPGRWFMLW